MDLFIRHLMRQLLYKLEKILLEYVCGCGCVRPTILVDHPSVLWLFLNFGSMRHSQRHMLTYLQECLVVGSYAHQSGSVAMQ